MHTINKYFEKFVDCLEETAEDRGNIPSFRDVCERLGAPESELDAFLEEMFGTGGEKIIESYRTSTPITMLP